MKEKVEKNKKAKKVKKVEENEPIVTNEIEKVEFTNEDTDIKNKKKNLTFFGYSLWEIFAYFVIYSFIGFITETIFGLLTTGVLESRKSMLVGPFCSIYGIGAICLICIPKRFKKNTIYLFIAGIIIGSFVEYMVSWGGECIYHVKWWDYSLYPFNLNGRICLFYSIFWGILTILLNKFINPRVDKYIMNKAKNKFSKKALHTFLICILIFYIIDFFVSSFATKMFFARVIYNNNINNVKGANEYYEQYLDISENHKTLKTILDTVFSDEVMLKAFPNLKITLEDGSVIFIRELLTNIQPFYFKVFTPQIKKPEQGGF